ncbi:MAG: amino acid ABC transporter substrate-binding protein [Desulfuromonadales bacterium]|nr:amino acid ABC transporter substrate-binding protein [Desulfuromonadales bacterium]
MKTTAFVSALVAVVVSVLVGIGLPSKSAKPGVSSVSDQITQAGKIRVGYTNVSVGFNVDPKTKQKSGIFVDVIEEMAKNMGLKVEYVEEVGWGTMIAGLQTKRYDMIASPVWPNSNRAKQATFSNPVYYSSIGIWVRQNENRFSPEGSWAGINKPEVKIGAFDGSTGEKIAQTLFPNAKIVSYPEGSGEGQLFLDVTSGKVDVFFEEAAKGFLYDKSNPGKVKNIAAEHPLKVFPNVFLLPAGDFRLKEMLDTALAEVENSGFVERAIRKYEPAPNTYYRVAPPYRVK